MLLGPIFSLELITSARRGRYYLLRTLYAIVLLFTLWATYASSQVRQPLAGIHGVANVAKDFFNVFSILQLLTIILLGPAMVAGAIAQERERRTIEYLFTSQLSNADIVLGKLGARLLNMGLLLVAGIPVLSLAMLLGGIPPAVLLSVSLLTLETLVAVGALSIAVSVGRRRTRDAVISAYLLLFALLVIPLFGYQLRYVAGRGFWGTLAELTSQLCEPVMKLNPFSMLADLGSGSPANGSLVLRLAWGLACYGGFAAACLLLAIAQVRRSYARTEGRGAVRRRFSLPAWRPAVWDRSMIWKEMFVEPALGRLGLAGRIALALLLLSMFVPWFFALGNAWGDPGRHGLVEITGMLVVCLQCFGVLMVAARGAGCVSSEKERDCWLALLSTPLAASEILNGKLLGNLFAIRWIAALVLVLWIGAVIIEPSFLPAVAVQLSTWALLLVYASWLGIAFSQWCRNSLRAMGATLGIGLFVGGLYLPFAAILTEMIAQANRLDLEWLLLAPCVPFLLSCPVIVWNEHIRSGGAGSHNGGLLVGYLFGLFGYGLATSLLWTVSVNWFNQLAGRMPVADGDRPQILKPD